MSAFIIFKNLVSKPIFSIVVGRRCAAVAAGGSGRRFNSIDQNLSETTNEGDNIEEKRHYEERRNKNESIEQKRARLLYQSRKRGILENDLLLSTFAHANLPSMSATELDEYDFMINTISNEWDIYHWAVGSKPMPEQYAASSVMQKFVAHVRNDNREQRFRQPDL